MSIYSFVFTVHERLFENIVVSLFYFGLNWCNACSSRCGLVFQDVQHYIRVFHCSSSSMAIYDGGSLASVSWKSVKFNIGAPWSSTSVPNFLAIGSTLNEMSNGSLRLPVPTYILRRRLRFSRRNLDMFWKPARNSQVESRFCWTW